MTFDVKAELKKLREDYEWRTPQGKAQRHLTIHRKLARIILDAIEPNNTMESDHDALDDAG
jgi:hypothetical protein